MKSRGAGSKDPAATPLTSSRIKEQARALGFDLCGVAAADSFPELSFLREWLDQGYAGEMEWLAQSVELRSDVRNVLPGARSVIMTGTLYNTDRPYSDQLPPAPRRCRGTHGATTTTACSGPATTASWTGCARCRRSRSRPARSWTPDRYRSGSMRST